MSKEKTSEEVRDEFLEHVRNLVDYWSKQKDVETKEKLNGLAFSILTTLDGCSGNLPGFLVAPLGSEENLEFCKENDKDYYPINSEDCVKCDIAGSLHEHFYRYKK